MKKTGKCVTRLGSTEQDYLTEVDGVLTHCNAGGLATAEYGTALSVFFTAQDHGRPLHVYVDETRPLLQGAAFDGLGADATRHHGNSDLRLDGGSSHA